MSPLDVTATAAWTPVGTTADQTAASIRARVARRHEHAEVRALAPRKDGAGESDGEPGEPLVVSPVRALDPGMKGHARVLELLVGVAKALEQAHAHGIIHRDLKPANIFVLPQDGGFDLVKVVDFGIATQVADGDGSRPAPARLTSPGMVLGTAEYMSPEQAQGMRTDHRVDQYALYW